MDNILPKNKNIFLYWVIFSILILLLGLFWIWYSKVPPTSSSENLISAPQKGFLAPDFSLSDMDGQTITLSELKGKPIMINFWASWCTPCRAEMPAIESVYKNYRDEDLIILGINTTNQDNINDATAFADKMGVTFPILFDLDGSVGILYQVRALPSTFFIDKQGVIVDVIVGGPMSEALIESKVKTIIEGSQ